MWQKEPTASVCLDCRLPFSFFFDLIDACWKTPQTTSNNLTLHRICTLARKLGASFVATECALARNEVCEDIDALDAHYGGGGRANAIQLSFFSGNKSPDGIDEIDSGALLATATVINYAPPNSVDYTHSYVFETILVPPHQLDDTGAKRQLLNNYICRDTNFKRIVRGREFQVSGFYYCQQNALVHVCAHACLRMALNSIDGSSAAVTSVEINAQLGLNPPLAGLSLQNIQDVIASKTGSSAVVADCSVILPADYLSILTSYIESGFIVLFVFTTSNTVEHVVTVFGHTRNSDEWHPQAIPGYSGPASAPFYRSSAWVDHFVIHDDNLGPYYTLSSRAFEVDKSITAHWIIGIHPEHQHEILPHYAENVAAIVLKGSLANFSAFGVGNWFNYIVQRPSTYVLRPILISRDGYKAHLLASIGHDQTKAMPGELDVADGLPDWFWMVEFSLPALFTGNRSKLGEVLIRSEVAGAKAPVDLVEAVRLPSLLATRNAPGGFDVHRIGLQSHSPYYTSRMHGNEW
ncbi:hypothetical protein BST63_33255 [Bradyrhizobium canariense]|uniref:YcaO domain-containing protein n=1 Tax=Bradyrhizobium canariense TaxID=255045 RepID=A0ABX3WTF9_9BRAD|nr:hypothetical protein [Bradyrhizobium canariense]OSJ11238.1 hypothetical protein BSR47_27095 [Bradyrhizobium canariense]OSJ21818.1 hypothetical protein BST63_33255 [Bradyrhizobium canariense]